MNENDIMDHLELLDGVLNSELASDQTMSLSELDGFMAGLIVCPVPVLPTEWMRQIWGEKGINVDDAEQARAIDGIVIARFKHLLFGLYQGFLHPIYDQDDDEQMSWNSWAVGISRAMEMRAEAWEMFGGHDGGLGGEDAQEAVSTLKRLCAYATLPEDQREGKFDADDQTLAMASNLIPEAILLLYGVKQASGVPIPVSLSDTDVKAGLKDTCPCGSGLEYQACCLAKDREARMEQAKKAEND